MSEYEIFNNEDVEIVPDKKSKKSKKVVVKAPVEKKECSFCKYLRENFKFAYIPAGLAILAIFFSLFVQFLPMVSFTIAALNASAAFFFIGFACAFAAVITEAINMFRENNFAFNIKTILILLAFFVLFI